MVLVYIGCEVKAHLSGEWTDWGGLIHVNDTVYMLFVSIEVKLWKYLKVNPNLELKAKAPIILTSEDVQFYWQIHWEKNEEDALLELIVEHYINTWDSLSLQASWNCIERPRRRQFRSRRESIGGASDVKEEEQ